jgi:cathepsin L
VVLSLSLNGGAAVKPTTDDAIAAYSFAEYVKDFQKTYSAEEYKVREAIFDAALTSIVATNKAGLAWRAGVNEFTDQRSNEVPKGWNRALGHSRKAAKGLGKKKPISAEAMAALPESVDWRDQGVVTSVKNQGGCGSCWAFSGTETLESHIAIETGVLFTLSEQEYVSCVENPDECGGTGGCSGATMELLFEHAVENGITTEWTYPYTSYYGSDGTCKVAQSSVATISGYTTLESNSYDELMTAVATVGPVAITVDASTWSSYAGGIYSGCNQESPELDHGVQLVGYGSEEGQNYWLVRNSWGPTWGEYGYIRLARTDDEASLCGVDVVPADGVGCAGGPPNVTVCGTCGILYDNSYPTGSALA